MRYAEYPPSPGLAALVEKFWFLEGTSQGAADTIIPDGRIELVFHYRGSFWREHPDGGRLRQPPSLLVGQMMQPVVLAPSGPTGVAAIRLQPASARTLLGFALYEVCGQFIDLDLIFPSAKSLNERLADAADDAARMRLLEAWLIGMACPAPRPH